MKLKILFASLLTLIFYSAHAQQTEKSKKHEIGIDAMPAYNYWDFRMLNNFNITYKYYIKKYAFKLRIGGDDVQRPKYEYTGINTPNSKPKEPYQYHVVNYPSIQQNFNTTLGMQYNYINTQNKTFFIGFDIRAKKDHTLFESLTENSDSSGLIYSNYEKKEQKINTLSTLATAGFTYRFKIGIGLTYELTYGYNFHKENSHQTFKGYDRYAGSNQSINQSKENYTISSYRETQYNLVSNLTVSYRF